MTETIRVTFDSNVWEKVVFPDRCCSHEEKECFYTIQQMIRSGKIKAYLCETIFMLEAIQKKNRLPFFAGYKPNIEVMEQELSNGEIALSIEIYSDVNIHQGNTPQLDECWKAAKLIGFKILRCSRIGSPMNPDLCQTDFESSTEEVRNRIGEIGREIEKRGCGIARMKKIGEESAKENQPWHEGFTNYFNIHKQDNQVAKAVAEWSDGDIVASHYGYMNDYICTRDMGKGAGEKSIFHPKNTEWLACNYNIQLISPEELVKQVSN